jgi:hypothetical protein
MRHGPDIYKNVFTPKRERAGTHWQLDSFVPYMTEEVFTRYSLGTLMDI